ncbi:MAG: DUF262 domain-containing protein [Thermodesulfobacteriota bacterium]|nr:DUF262 domain-containing protein [Thermodesulfobacteriota bacterium]
MKISERTRKQINAEIAAARNDIRTDKLDVSYGELANLYENTELVIRPEYQRLFRWTPTQKSRFIESILLGFPTPAIFVAEDDKGVWELVDGLQRVSSVLEFMGVLKDAKDVTGTKLLSGSVLVRAGHKPRLPSIEGVSFSDLSLQARLSIKRAGCRVEVIKVGSHPKMKYDVFERLNTGGSSLEPQEVRNCIFRATAPDFVEWIEKLAAFPPFREYLGMSELQANTMFDRGLILRYFTLRNAYKEFEHDVEPFITDFVRQVLENERGFDRNGEDASFKETFKRISEALGEDAWRHYRDGRHKGPLSVYVFETISVGISRNLSVVSALSSSQLKRRIVEFKQRPEFVNNTGAGANIRSKLHSRIDFAISFFSKA